MAKKCLSTTWNVVLTLLFASACSKPQLGDGCSAPSLDWMEVSESADHKVVANLADEFSKAAASDAKRIESAEPHPGEFKTSLSDTVLTKIQSTKKVSVTREFFEKATAYRMAVCNVERQIKTGLLTSYSARDAAQLELVALSRAFGSIHNSEQRLGPLPPEAVNDAVQGWGNGTAIIRKLWWEYAQAGYREKLARLLDVPIDRLGEKIAEDRAKAEAMRNKIFNEYENAAHSLLAQQIPTADPFVVNPILRHHFGEIKISLPGTPSTSSQLKDVLNDGFPMTKRFFEAMFEASASGLDPSEDLEVMAIYEKYVERRQAVFEALTSVK